MGAEEARHPLSPTDSRAASRPWSAGGIALVVVVLALGLAQTFGALATSDPGRFVLAQELRADRGPGDHPSGPLNFTDHRFVVWLVARNARTLSHHPWRLFDAEPCHPAPNALLAGEPGVTLGALGIPAALAGASPVAVFNASFVLATALAYLAMVLLVRDWTGSVPAAVAAGLLYAFHPIRLSDIIHLYVWDMAWTAFALWLAPRFFAEGRLRQALALSAVIAAQVGGSLYPLLAAALIALPVVVWLGLRHGRAALRWRPWALLAGLVLVASALLLGPYLLAAGDGPLPVRRSLYYRPLTWLGPGRDGFPGWPLLALAVLAALPGGLRRGRGDPRPALLAGGALCLLLTVGALDGADVVILRADEGWTAWRLLALVVPGLDVVRSPGSLYAGVHLVLAVLAGVGAAAGLRRLPERARLPVAALGIALVFADTLRPLGLPPHVPVRPFELAPPAEDVAFYAALEGTGAVFEVPVRPEQLRAASAGTLHSAYHGRRTSSCYHPGLVPPELEALSDAMPSEAALERLRALGFDAVVVHHPPMDLYGPRRVRAFADFAARSPSLAPSAAPVTERLTGYRILPAAEAAAGAVAPERRGS